MNNKHAPFRLAGIWLSLAMLCLSIFLSPRTPLAEMVDRVMAVVNDEVITLSEVEEEATDAYRSIAKSLSGESLTKALDEARASALDSLISQVLIRQKAEKSNITVTDEEIAEAYEKMRARRYPKMSDDEFKDNLADSGMSEERLKKHLGVQILQNKLISYDVRSKIVVTEDMILDYYDEHYTARVDKGTFYLLQIGMTFGNDATSAEKQKQKMQIERVRQLAIDGDDFRELARKYSELPSAADGGDIGVFSLDDMAGAMREAIGALAPGDISEIVDMSDSYQFFKVLSGDDSTIVVKTTYESVKDDIREQLYEEKLKESYADWVKELKDHAYIQKM